MWTVKRKLKAAKRPDPTAPATLGSWKNTLTRKEKVQMEETNNKNMTTTRDVSLSAKSPVYDPIVTTRSIAVVKVASSDSSQASQKTVSLSPMQRKMLRNPLFFSVTMLTKRICIDGIHAATKYKDVIMEIFVSAAPKSPRLDTGIGYTDNCTLPALSAGVLPHTLRRSASCMVSCTDSSPTLASDHGDMPDLTSSSIVAFSLTSIFTSQASPPTSPPPPTLAAPKRHADES
jgi:hypothetical protein